MYKCNINETIKVKYKQLNNRKINVIKLIAYKLTHKYTKI